MYIKDLQSGEIRKYGTNCHDSLRITDDGLYYDGVYAVLKILKQALAIIPATKEGEDKECRN